MTAEPIHQWTKEAKRADYETAIIYDLLDNEDIFEAVIFDKDNGENLLDECACLYTEQDALDIINIWFNNRKLGIPKNWRKSKA